MTCACEARHQLEGESQRTARGSPAWLNSLLFVPLPVLDAHPSQVQKLLAKHKAEVAAVQAAAGEEARRVGEAAAAAQEAALKALKERMAKV